MKCSAQRRGSNSRKQPAPLVPNEAVRYRHEESGQASVVSGQRIATSSGGTQSRICQSVLGARRGPQGCGFVRLCPRRQASSWQASLVSADRLAFVLIHQSQWPEWHTPRLPVTAPVLPNPSLEARPNIKTPGPRGGLAHFPPRGPGVLLSVPPQLER